MKDLVVVLIAQIFIKYRNFALNTRLQSVDHQVLILHLFEELPGLADLFDVFVVSLCDHGEDVVNFFSDLLLRLVHFLLDLL